MAEGKDRIEGFWNGLWCDDQNHTFWKRVSLEAVDLIESYRPQEKPAVLDLGCGLGRNAIAFAQAGFNVTATALSSSAVTHLEQWAARLGLQLRTLVCDFADDAFPAASFDIIVSINVIYHGHRDEFVRAINNVRRWLRTKGVFCFTCPTRDDGQYGEGKELAPHTFLLEPGHLHYYVDEADLDSLLQGFRQLSRKRRESHWEKDGVPQ